MTDKVSSTYTLEEGICHTSNATGKARNRYYRRLDMERGLLENLDQ